MSWAFTLAIAAAGVAAIASLARAGRGGTSFFLDALIAGGVGLTLFGLATAFLGADTMSHLIPRLHLGGCRSAGPDLAFLLLVNAAGLGLAVLFIAARSLRLAEASQARREGTFLVSDRMAIILGLIGANAAYLVAGPSYLACLAGW